jgi:hemerythrin-like domain-containing protein
MSKTVERLQTDHHRLRAILETLSEACTELKPDDFDALGDHLFCLVDYLHEYPNQVHHPTEDLVFNDLLELDLTKEQLEKVAHNKSQHTVLNAATAELVALVDSPTGDIDIDIELFQKKATEYVALQLKHMDFEEREIFPLALSQLSSDSWEVLDNKFGQTNDPLFDEADRKYAAVFRLIAPRKQEQVLMAEPLLQYLAATSASPDK